MTGISRNAIIYYNQLLKGQNKMMRIKAPTAPAAQFAINSKGGLDYYGPENPLLKWTDGYIIDGWDYGDLECYQAWEARHGTKEENPRRGV